MNDVNFRCKDCNNYFAIISKEGIKVVHCPECESKNVEHATDKQDEEIINYLKTI